jgi:ubiquinone/menaquinone biosynthesis C-methylase UbiE
MRHFSRSLIRSFSKAEVLAEYSLSSQSPEEYQKAKWGSPESMHNRFQLALKLVQWHGVRRWLDVGCGTGLFFSVAQDAGIRSDMVGVDITPGMIEQALRHKYRHLPTFVVADLEMLPAHLGLFDLVTAIGVLQQCGVALNSAFKALARVTAPGGQLFLDTKNIGWRRFHEDGITPEPGHSWFDWADIERALPALGFTVVRAGGFLPRDGRVVPIEDSHTVFVLAKRDT